MYERYCKLRDLKGLNDSQVSEYCGFPKSTFSDWKKGKSEPKLSKIRKIAELLDCSIDYLANGKEWGTADYSPANAELTVLLRHDAELVKALQIYEKLPQTQKDAIINMIKSYKVGE